MERSDIKPGLVYVLTEDYRLWSAGTEVEIIDDDGSKRPFSKKVGTKNDTYFVPISKMAISKKQKLHIGDRIVNIGKGQNNINGGKFGTVVDYDSSVDEYAVVYDDGGPGCGGAEHYLPAPHAPPGRQPNRSEIEASKQQLGWKTMVYQAFQQALPPIQVKTTKMSTSQQIQKMINGAIGSTASVTANGGGGGVQIFHLTEEGLGFAVGQQVKFKGTTPDSTRVPSYWRDESDGIPNNLIVDGSINVGDEYFKNWGTVVGITDKYVVVKYDDERNNKVQLGFEPKSLISAAFVPKPLDVSALDKLVLDADTKSEIVAVLKQFEHSEKLFTHWGLGETIEYGKGMTMMFWGGPGTGKTWGAHCIAKALGQELMAISAAEIQSSEPGATERNLQDAFRSATEEHKVLFIDECDSIITTRSDLGMILAAQVNCLLTEIEKFEGVCILATNRIETMDEALERRVALIVEFPFPKYAQRIEIWKKLLPTKLPLAEGITPETLAQPKFTGGLIKNIILQAARLALASGGEVVSQADFDKATERLKKSKGLMGKRARSETGRPREDMGMGVGVDRKVSVDLETFLDSDEDEGQK